MINKSFISTGKKVLNINVANTELVPGKPATVKYILIIIEVQYYYFIVQTINQKKKKIPIGRCK